jgi:hypothetical protein
MSKPIKRQCWWLTSVILATWEAEIKSIWVQSQSGQIQHKIYLKKTQHKKGCWDCAVTQVVEWLASKCEALSSNPSTNLEWPHTI